MERGDSRAKPPVAPRGDLANRFYANLSGFFKWYAEPGVDKVRLSPLIGLPRPFKREAARTRFFNDSDLKAIWKASDQIGGVCGAFLKVALLTGKRRGMLAAMRRGELSEDGLWSPPEGIPGRNMNKRTHVTPLPKLAVCVLAALRPKLEILMPRRWYFLVVFAVRTSTPDRRFKSRSTI